MTPPKLLAFLAWEGILGGTLAALGSSLETHGPEPVICILLRLRARGIRYPGLSSWEMTPRYPTSPQLKAKEVNAQMISLTVVAVLWQQHAITTTYKNLKKNVANY